MSVHGRCTIGTTKDTGRLSHPARVASHAGACLGDDRRFSWVFHDLNPSSCVL